MKLKTPTAECLVIEYLWSFWVLSVVTWVKRNAGFSSMVSYSETSVSSGRHEWAMLGYQVTEKPQGLLLEGSLLNTFFFALLEVGFGRLLLLTGQFPDKFVITGCAHKTRGYGAVPRLELPPRTKCLRTGVLWSLSLTQAVLQSFSLSLYLL